MGHLIDTSVLIAFERGDLKRGELQARIASGSVVVAAITISELLHGAHRADTATRREARSSFVEELIAFVPVLAFDLEVAKVHSRIWADLATAGALIGGHDMQIAATAIHHKLALATRNTRDFNRVEGLKIEAW